MIRKVAANHASFKTTEFGPGLNVVWADRTQESTKKDSRNGLGKSTLIEIIHFCLGARATKGKGLAVEKLNDWEFSVTLDLGGREITVSRSVKNPRTVAIAGNTDGWPIEPKTKKGRRFYGISDWNSLLGFLQFGLSTESEEKYRPSFRSLISYVARRSKDSYSTPFEHYRKQSEWDKQVHNAFLLGLAWQDAAELQELKDRRKGLENFKKAAKAGVVKGFVGSLGDLEAQRIRLQAQVDQEAAELRSFKVHLQYDQVQAEANRLTDEIHSVVNANTSDKRLLSLYERSLVKDQPPPADSIDRLYKEAGIQLPGVALRRIEDVRAFHDVIVKNRSAFLASEIERLRREIGKRDDLLQAKTNQRAASMEVLQNHGALAEYTALQTRHMESINKLNSINSTIDNLKSFDTGLSDIKIAHEVLQQRSRRDYDDRRTLRERAVTLFNTYSEKLYSVPGKLIIDVGPNGFRFDVNIERSASSGISNMKVFCYDLMLARLWAERRPTPGMLVHDSLIFDGVDERQRALALETAAAEAAASGFQYICTLNSDYIPWDEFSKDFDLRKHVRLTLTDESIEGCLLGIRF